LRAFRYKLLVVVIFAACIGAFLRTVPIGNSSYLRAHKELGQNINISEPRYWVPRELVFPSTLGSPLRPFRDPHFAATAPIEFSVRMSNELIVVTAQGFEVNRSFSKAENKKHILAMRTADEIFKFEVGDVCFTCWTSRGELFALGQTQDQFIFLINNPFGNDPTNEHHKKHGLIAIELPFGSADAGELTHVGSKLSEQLLDGIKRYPQDKSAFDEICASRTIKLGVFLNDRFAYRCDWL